VCVVCAFGQTAPRR